MKKAALLISHGSKSTKTKEEVLSLIEPLKKLSDLDIIECAFLELESPNIPQGIEICVSKGATKIIILLNFLNSGKHVNDDIPHIIDVASKKYPHIHFSTTKPIGQHIDIVNLFHDYIQSS